MMRTLRVYSLMNFPIISYFSISFHIVVFTLYITSIIPFTLEQHGEKGADSCAVENPHRTFDSPKTQL